MRGPGQSRRLNRCYKDVMAIRTPATDGRENEEVVLLFGDAPPDPTASWLTLARWFGRETWSRVRGRSAVRLDLTRGPLSDKDILRGMAGAGVLLVIASALGTWRATAGDPVGTLLGVAFAGIFVWHLRNCFARDIPRRAHLRRGIAADFAKARRRHVGTSQAEGRRYGEAWSADERLVHRN